MDMNVSKDLTSKEVRVENEGGVVNSSETVEKERIIGKLKASSHIKSPEHVRQSIKVIKQQKLEFMIPLAVSGLVGSSYTAGFIVLAILLKTAAAMAFALPLFGVVALTAIGIFLYLMVTRARGSVEAGENHIQTVLTSQYDQQTLNMDFKNFVKEKHPEATIEGWNNIDMAEFAEEFTLSELKALEKEVDRLSK